MSRILYPCDRIPGFAYDYLENRLPRVTSLRFQAHLRLCKGCSEFVRLYRMAADPGRFLEETSVPPELVDHTLAFLEKELKKDEKLR